MNEIRTFNNLEFGEIRTITINEQPWFVGKDVAEALGYGDGNKRSKALTNAIKDHVDEEDKALLPYEKFKGYQNGDLKNISHYGAYIINESGLYSLILSSKLPSAKKFKRWVTGEVLPSIRKHGAYAVDELLNNPDMAIKAFTALKEEREKNKLLQADNERMRPKEIFADAVAGSKTSILIGDLAKILKRNGYDTGQKRLFEQLRREGYLIKSGVSKNMPTQRAMEMGLLEIKETSINNPDGSVRVTKTTKVTGKGQQYFINRYLRRLKESNSIKTPLS